jgi:hypothetical protein
LLAALSRFNVHDHAHGASADAVAGCPCFANGHGGEIRNGQMVDRGARNPLERVDSAMCLAKAVWRCWHTLYRSVVLAGGGGGLQGGTATAGRHPWSLVPTLYARSRARAFLARLLRESRKSWERKEFRFRHHDNPVAKATGVRRRRHGSKRGHHVLVTRSSDSLATAASLSDKLLGTICLSA